MAASFKVNASKPPGIKAFNALRNNDAGAAPAPITPIATIASYVHAGSGNGLFIVP